MKKFVFRLEPYLKVCRFREEAEELRLGECLKARSLVEQGLIQLEKDLRQSSETLSKARSLPVYEARWYVLHIRGLEHRIEAEQVRLAAADRAVEEQRQKLIEARRKLKPVEKLKERRRVLHEQEQDRQAQAEADDLHLQRLARTARLG